MANERCSLPCNAVFRRTGNAIHAWKTEWKGVEVVVPGTSKLFSRMSYAVNFFLRYLVLRLVLGRSCRHANQVLE